METPPLSVGIDFGTTNTVVAVAHRDGRAETIAFDHRGDSHRVYMSALCFWQERARTGPLETRVEGGPWAVERFLEGIGAHRFIQSFKTFAASPSFQETWIFRQRYRFEDLLIAFFRTLFRHAGPQPAFGQGTVVIGRPVRFAGLAPDEHLAMSRYRSAFGQLGFSAAHYVYEPVGAAFFFARQLRADAIVVVADFGGGTSDFSIIRFVRQGSEFRAYPLGHAGIAIAGDAFDYRIIDHLVSPALGKGGQYRSFGKLLPIPSGFFSSFARWNQLAMMKTSGELRQLRELSKIAVD